MSATSLYGRHREGDCSDRCPLCAEQERAERDTSHVCSGYCDPDRAAFEDAHREGQR